MRDISTAIGITIIGASLAIALLQMSARLPEPPKYTQKEMYAREARALDNHLKVCYTCKVRDGWYTFCDESAKIQDESLTVGNWKMYPLGWVWRGPPQGDYIWDYKDQEWRRNKM
jgi:hypothetical protein